MADQEEMKSGASRMAATDENHKQMASVLLDNEGMEGMEMISLLEFQQLVRDIQILQAERKHRQKEIMWNGEDEEGGGGGITPTFGTSRQPMEGEEVQILPNDAFSFLAFASLTAPSMLMALICTAVQVATLTFMLLDVAVDGLEIPPSVPSSVRAVQVLCLITSVFSQSDIYQSVCTFMHGYSHQDMRQCFPQLRNASPRTIMLRWYLSLMTRLLIGIMGIAATVLLIIVEEAAREILLNFTAIEFVSYLDDITFIMAKSGFFGTSTEQDAHQVSCANHSTLPTKRRWIPAGVFSFLLAVVLSAWGIVVHRQLSGEMVCSTVFVQFSDEFIPELATLSGLYERSSEFLNNGRFQYLLDHPGHHRGKAMFGYCKKESAWTLAHADKSIQWHEGETLDPCNWTAISSRIASHTGNSFDISSSAAGNWFVQSTGSQLVPLQRITLQCYDCDDDFCGGSTRGSCVNNRCECLPGWYGLRCEYEDPCENLEVDTKSETNVFGKGKNWSKRYHLLYESNISEAVVSVHSRPVYINDLGEDGYDMLFFNGRRWALTTKDWINITRDELAYFLQNHFHAYWSVYHVGFMSDAVDVDTPLDSSTAIGLKWYHVKDKRAGEKSSPDPNDKSPAVLICAACSNTSNPCLYEGICKISSNGTPQCHCSNEATGPICQFSPLSNGRCNPYFNTPDFGFDGGDCCESTCISTQLYQCGREESGYVNKGFPYCHLDNTTWEGHSLRAPVESGSYAGYSLDLSLGSAVVTELLQNRVRVYDKVGSSWELRDTIVATPPNTKKKIFFGTRVAVSAGSYNVVSTPSFLPLLTVAVLEGNLHVLRIYNCKMQKCTFSQEIQDVLSFELSADGTVLSTSLFDRLRPASTIRLFEMVEGSFQHRGNITFTKDAHSVLSQALSGDGGSFVLQKQHIERGVSRGETLEIYAWNGTFYNLESQLPYVANFTAFKRELSLAISQDASVIACGVQECRHRDLQVFERDQNNTWVARSPPAINITECMDTERPKRNNNLALSKDGSTVAFRLGTAVTVFKWESNEWKKAGEDFPMSPHYPIALSSDGKELAIGSPENSVGVGGVATVHRLRGRENTCPKGTKHLRISLTLDRRPDGLTWELKNNHTGEMLNKQGPYPENMRFGTIVENVCVNVESHCYEFTIYNRRNKGLKAPGMFALFLDGEDIGRGRFEGFFEKISFGNCVALSCREGLEPLRMTMLTCAPLTWEVFKITDDESNKTALLEVGTLPGTDPTVFDSCGIERPICGWAPEAKYEPVPVEYNHCIDPGECYGVKLTSPNRQVSLMELQLGDHKRATDQDNMCAGNIAKIGNCWAY